MMRAMLLQETKKPLVLQDIPKPKPKENELLIQVRACGVCRTDLHVKDGELPHPKLPLVLGHEIVGVVEELGKDVQGFQKGDRVGVPWLGGSCGHCEYCQAGQENLCDNAQFTGYLRDGGFAEYTTCQAEYAVHLPAVMSDLEIAPLLCAGLVGFRSYRKAGPEKSIGLYGFGASAHIIAQIATHQGKQVYAFTRDGDKEGQEFAMRLGAVWAGGSSTSPPELLDAAIIFAPIGGLIPVALRALKKGGRCICGGIHMSDIPSFPYKDLWWEKSIQSVANLTRDDSREFFSLVSKFPVTTQITKYPLENADQALEDLRNGKFHGAAVLEI
jgi:propanol-preferring alcohol dehydrogenase